MRVVVDREGYEVGVHIGFPWLTAFQQTRCRRSSERQRFGLHPEQKTGADREPGAQVLEIPRTELTDTAGLCYLGYAS